MFRRIFFAAAVLLVAVQHAAFAADDGMRHQQFGPTTRYTVTLDKALRNGRHLTLHLGLQDGEFRQIWGTVQGLSRIVDDLDARGLKAEGDGLRGVIKVGFVHDGLPGGVVAEYTLDLTNENGELSGSYEGWWAQRTGGIKYLVDRLVIERDEMRWEYSDPYEVNGDAAGTVRDEAALQEGQRIAAGQDWPWYAGPQCNFSAAPSDQPLIDDMRHARLVWRSEHTPPSRCQVTRYGEGCMKRVMERGGPAGGGGSPVLADGRVYLWYFQPDGKAYNEGIVEGMRKRNAHTMTNLWSLRAEDVFLCLDAATGRTLWKVVMPGGRYLDMNGRRGSTKGWYTTNMAVADGRVYGATTNDDTYCLDAATGEILWKRRLGVSSLRIVVDGVLLPSGDDLVGYDGKTGDELWRIPGVNSDSRAPLRWEVDGKTYVVAGGPSGNVVCVEPRSGRERWRIEGLGGNDGHLLIGSNHLFVNTKPGDDDQLRQLAAYRITPDGFEKAWELPESYHYFPRRKYPLTYNGRLYFQVPRRPNDVPKGMKLVSQRMVCIDIASGKILAETPGPVGDGMAYQLGNSLLLQLDSTHSRTPLLQYATDPDAFGPLGDRWETDHTTTSSYWPVLMGHAIGDGRIFIRGAMGIYCYDLRQSAEHGRIVAAVELSKRDADQAVAALQQFLNSPKQVVRIDAARALGELGDKAAAAAPRLLQLATTGDAAMAEAAYGALSRMGSSAAGACAAAAQVDDAEKRRIAVVALGKIGHAGPAAMEALRERLQDPSLAVRVATVEAAEQLGTAARPLTDDLVALYDRDEDPQIDNAIVEAFLQIQPETSLPPQFVDPLVHILTRRASGDGYAAGRIVARIGAPALPALIENIKSDSRLRSWRAAYTVGQMGRIAEPAVPALEDALKRAEERNRNTWAKMVRTALKQIRG